MIAWLAARSLREKRLLLVMLALLGVTIVWGGIILPVRDALSSTREAHRDAAVRLGQTENAVRVLRAIQRGRPQPLGAPLADVVRARADAAGFALASLDPDGDRIRIAIATAKPGALLTWIAALEAEGVLVESASITGNGDGTAAAQLTLKARTS